MRSSKSTEGKNTQHVGKGTKVLAIDHDAPKGVGWGRVVCGS